MNLSKLKLSFCLLLLLSVNNGLVSAADLSPFYYLLSCPSAVLTIKAVVAAAVLQEHRMGASLLRLHFHDCFVQGCDASVLLDDTSNFIGEKNADTNINSARGFEVIDQIKSILEFTCPGVVSCADILAVAARDSVVALGGPSWQVRLGRKDSITANLTEANTDLPLPSLDLNGLIDSFSKKGFTPQEMVALSGSHTLGQARCFTFRDRAYNDTNIDPSFAASLRGNCPRTGADGSLTSFDDTPNYFDSSYFKNLVSQKGLLHSDQAIFNGGSTDSIVANYAFNLLQFRSDFAAAMAKMSELVVLTGSKRQVRRNCRRIN
ncbi:hypothetical protein K1719_001717 [Acacia pycnantha]|nr:hypothetical protein K1719_001717 [Acacia pycnantha]